MADEIQLTRDRDRGVQAKVLMESPLLVEAFATLEDGYLSAWRTTHALDTQAREKLFIAVNVLAKVKDHLRSVVANGTLAAKELEQLTAEAERKKRFRIL